jgi:succinoglycan biosynthesis transport protein ExoP
MSPTLHQHFGLSDSPGLSDCLRAAQGDAHELAETIDGTIRPAPDELNLDILPAGEAPADPTSLVSSPALAAVIEALRERDYAYVLIDSPPLLGISDAQLLARQADSVLLVGRLDRISPYQAEELHGLLSRLELEPIGLTVVGARAEFSPYYVTERAFATP